MKHCLWTVHNFKTVYVINKITIPSKAIENTIGNANTFPGIRLILQKSKSKC